MMMKQLTLIHWKPEEVRAEIDRIRKAGFDVHSDVPAGRDFLKLLAKQTPSAILIDLSRLPSQGRDMAVLIRRQASTRRIPLIFIGGNPDKTQLVQALLPDAVFTNWDQILPALGQALSQTLESPVTPDSAFAGYFR